jgi:fumarylpyruvate hydrolase
VAVALCNNHRGAALNGAPKCFRGLRHSGPRTEQADADLDHAAVIGPIRPPIKTGNFSKGAVSLAINGTVKQSSDLQNMIWSVAEQVAKLSESFELKADIIYSGTPENVGPVVKGDVLLCKLEGLPDMSIRIT